MTQKKFIILKAETYEKEGTEKFRFAASVSDDDNISNVIFFFDDYTLSEKDGDLQAQSFIHFGEQVGDKLVQIKEDDPRYSFLRSVSSEILEQVTKFCLQEVDKTVEKTESFLESSVQ